MEKVKLNLAGWKASMLSLAGRATLIQTTTAAIPVYSMQTAKVPLGVCDEIGKGNRNFLWGGTEAKRKLHSVN